MARKIPDGIFGPACERSLTCAEPYEQRVGRVRAALKIGADSAKIDGSGPGPIRCIGGDFDG